MYILPVQDQLASYKTALDNAKVNADNLTGKESLRQLQEELKKTKITAPCDGMVTAVYAEEGASGAGLLFLIEDAERLVVHTTVKGYDLGEVHEGLPVVIQSEALGDTELEGTLKKLGEKPKLVITDSQVFGKVAKLVPNDVLLTSFSILFARYKGNLDVLVNGAKTLDSLQDGDKILVAEGCTHHRQCGDIGSVKIPALIRKHNGKNVEFVFCSGMDFPEDLSFYAMVVHCGGCTLTEQVMQNRLSICEEAGVAITNYGMAIAHMNGILVRSMEVFYGNQTGTP